MSQSTNLHDLYADHDVGDAAAAMEMIAARLAALDILNAVLGEHKALDGVLEESKSFRTLPQRDRAFCRMLVATVLRRLGQIDDILHQAEEKPAPKNPIIQNILRLGATQILFMGVPDHAAVDTAVRLVDAAQMDRQKGFVNAMLRTVARVGKEWLARQDEATRNTPQWLLQRWIADYGLRGAGQIAQANLSEAALDITIKDEKDRAYWISALKAVQLGCRTLRCKDNRGNVQDMPGFNDGMWWVQDAAAAIPAHLFGDVAGKTVLDLCAAPGGKTAQLAAMGAQVIALDRSAQRLKRLRQNLQRLRLEERVEVVVSDATVWRPREAPRYILCDAPCTATGTIRRHPDILHLKTETDLQRLVSVQAEILENAYAMLAPGGVLIYCVCSLQKEEGEAQIEALLSRHVNAIKLAITPDEVGGLREIITEEGDVRSLPFHLPTLGGIDGFYISRISKSV